MMRTRQPATPIPPRSVQPVRSDDGSAGQIDPSSIDPVGVPSMMAGCWRCRPGDLVPTAAWSRSGRGRLGAGMSAWGPRPDNGLESVWPRECRPREGGPAHWWRSGLEEESAGRRECRPRPTAGPGRGGDAGGEGKPGHGPAWSAVGRGPVRSAGRRSKEAGPGWRLPTLQEPAQPLNPAQTTVCRLGLLYAGPESYIPA
jgi:hypothetical protein